MVKGAFLSQPIYQHFFSLPCENRTAAAEKIARVRLSQESKEIIDGGLK